MKASFKVKISLLIAVPVGGFLMLAVLLMNQALEQKNLAIDTSDAASFFMAATEMIHETQIERGKSALFVNGKLEKSELDKQRDIVNAKSEALLKTAAEVPFEKKSTEYINPILEELATTRKSADNKEDSKAISAHYTNMIKNLIDIDIAASRLPAIDGINSGFTSVIMLEVAKENTGRIRALLTNFLSTNAPVGADHFASLEKFYSAIISNIDSPILRISQNSVQLIKQFKESKDWAGVLHAYNTVTKEAANGNYGIPAEQFYGEVTRSINAQGVVVTGELKTLLETALQAKAKHSNFFWQLMSAVIIVLIGLMWLSVQFIRSFSNQLITISNELLLKAEEVAKASAQLNDASQSLSSSVSEQAASLQESVSSIEQISAMVNKNADNSKSTLDLSTSNLQMASEGKETVIEMQASIEEINQSNAAIMKQIENSNEEMQNIVKVINEIGSKTQVINDIVFQTKLLSFNASVEAARAGEQGKGFAVVAEEVGNLASMSGNAAKEISVLLKGSIEKVESIVNQTRQKVDVLVHQGQEKVLTANRTASECAAILDNVCLRANEMNKMVGEIATASQEQSTGVQEINKAMGQLDSTTQTNSSSAQQSSAVADALSQQASSMKTAAEQLSFAIYGPSGSRKAS